MRMIIPLYPLYTDMCLMNKQEGQSSLQGCVPYNEVVCPNCVYCKQQLKDKSM